MSKMSRFFLAECFPTENVGELRVYTTWGPSAYYILRAVLTGALS